MSSKPAFAGKVILSLKLKTHFESLMTSQRPHWTVNGSPSHLFKLIGSFTHSSPNYVQASRLIRSLKTYHIPPDGECYELSFFFISGYYVYSAEILSRSPALIAIPQPLPREFYKLRTRFRLELFFVSSLVEVLRSLRLHLLRPYSGNHSFSSGDIHLCSRRGANKK